MKHTDNKGKIAKEIREKIGKRKLKDFAEMVGIDKVQLSRYSRGVSVPRADIYRKIMQFKPIEQTVIVREESPEYGEEFVTIPQVTGKISAGGGLVPDNTIEMRVAFRRDWILRKGSPQNMSLIRVIGDSMEPTLESGDLVLVDHSRDFVDPHGGIYAIVFDDEIMLKRLQILYPSKKVRVISDNPRYEPIEIERDQIKINGKVIWFARDLER